jgi:hypothetical protein
LRPLRRPGAQRHRPELILGEPLAAPGHPALDLVELLSLQTCAAIVASARRSTAWQDAPIYLSSTPNVNPAVRLASVLYERDLAPELGTVLDDVRARSVQLERARGAGLEIGEIQLVRYRAGGFFYTHQDATESPKEWRKLSFVVYLNDDFAGGATCFPSLGVNVQPRTGYALLFAPHCVHYADAVAAGEKYIFLFWLGRHGP